MNENRRPWPADTHDMNWLFTTSRFPWPLIHGANLRVFHLSRTLVDMGDSVALLARETDGDGPAAYRDAGVEVLPPVPGQAPSAGPGRVRGAPYVFEPVLADALKKACASYEAVVLVGPKMLQYAPDARGAGRVVADVIDDPVTEERRRFWGDLRPTAMLRRLRFLLAEPRYERAFASRADLLTFVSPADASAFGARHGTARVLPVANGVDADYFARPPERQIPPSPPRVVFTGHMSNPNNIRAARFLIERVAPLLWKAVPDAVVQIVGADAPPALHQLAGSRVEVTGRVEDIRPYIWDAAAVALPMQSGTGIKNKLLEAWAAGAAVVATPLACGGTPARDGTDVLIRRSPDALADALGNVLGDDNLRMSLGRQGRATIERELTWQAVATKLREEVAALADHSGGVTV